MAEQQLQRPLTSQQYNIPQQPPLQYPGPSQQQMHYPMPSHQPPAQYPVQQPFQYQGMSQQQQQQPPQSRAQYPGTLQQSFQYQGAQQQLEQHPPPQRPQHQPSESAPIRFSQLTNGATTTITTADTDPLRQVKIVVKQAGGTSGMSAVKMESLKPGALPERPPSVLLPPLTSVQNTVTWCTGLIQLRAKEKLDNEKARKEFEVEKSKSAEAEKKAKANWTCEGCTFENEYTAKICSVCSKTRHSGSESEFGGRLDSQQTQRSNQGSAEWACVQCTYLNKVSVSTCEICHEERPRSGV